MALLDWEMFLERVERNEKLALELAHDLILCLDGRIETLGYAISQAEIKKVEQAAHALRGLVAPYGGRELLVILKEIEEKARGGVVDFTALPLEIGKMAMALKDEVESKISSIERVIPHQRGHFLS